MLAVIIFIALWIDYSITNPQSIATSDAVLIFITIVLIYYRVKSTSL
jgi:hypothetical protein